MHTLWYIERGLQLVGPFTTKTKAYAYLIRQGWEFEEAYIRRLTR